MQILKEQEKMAQSVKQILSKVSAHIVMHMGVCTQDLSFESPSFYFILTLLKNKESFL